MDTLLRLLPIVVVLFFALLVNPYRAADAQTFPQTIPLQFNYQSGNVNDIYTTSQTDQSPTNLLHFNVWWLLIILAIAATYFVWTKIEELLISREPVGRGYIITYQDIRPLKKRTFKTAKRSQIL